MTSNEAKRQLNKYSRFLEPLMVVALMAMIILPTLSVLNVSPETKISRNRPSNVLGVSDNPGILMVSLINDPSSTISRESLKEQQQVGQYQYLATLSPREFGTYKKPVFEISNGLEKDLKVVFSIKPTDSNAEIGITYNGTNYVLKDHAGNLYAHTMDVTTGEYFLLLSVKTLSNVNFSEDIEINISVSGLETESTETEL